MARDIFPVPSKVRTGVYVPDAVIAAVAWIVLSGNLKPVAWDHTSPVEVTEVAATVVKLPALGVVVPITTLLIWLLPPEIVPLNVTAGIGPTIVVAKPTEVTGPVKLRLTEETGVCTVAPPCTIASSSVPASGIVAEGKAEILTPAMIDP